MGREQQATEPGAAARRHHLADVADAFLSAAPGARAAAPPLLAAAPGSADTRGVLERLAAGRGGRQVRDLGGRVRERLSDWEREGLRGVPPTPAPLLVWCPRADEALSLAGHLDLGRLAALLRPARVTVLWLAAEAGRQSPPAALRARVAALAAAAVPSAVVTVHCLGWSGPADRQLAELAARYC